MGGATVDHKNVGAASGAEDEYEGPDFEPLSGWVALRSAGDVGSDELEGLEERRENGAGFGG